jgi:hypothetical protein
MLAVVVEAGLDRDLHPLTQCRPRGLLETVQIAAEDAGRRAVQAVGDRRDLAAHPLGAPDMPGRFAERQRAGVVGHPPQRQPR